MLEVNSAVEAAAAAYPAWRDTPITERVQLMFKFKDALERNLHELAVLLSTEMGKAYGEARGDVLKAIEEPIADELVAAIVELAKDRKMGPAWEAETELGPLVTDDHRDFVNGWIEKSIEEGAKLVLDGRGATVPGYEGGYFLGPTVFDHVTPEMSCGWEEVFGPVLYIKRIKEFEEGIQTINASEFVNGASIFTMSGHFAREFARRIDGGMVGVNVGIPVPISAFPFCGHKNSFFGDLHVMGRDGVAFYTETKAVTSYWYNEADLKGEKVGTWEGTITRS